MQARQVRTVERGRAPGHPARVRWIALLILGLAAASPLPAQAQDVATAHARWAALLADGEGWSGRATEREYELALALVHAERWDEAEKHWRRLAVQVRRFNGKGSAEDVIVRSRWAETLTQLERWDEVETVASPAYVAAMRRFGADDLNTDRLRISLGAAMISVGRSDVAVAFLQPSFDFHMAHDRIGDARVVAGALAPAYARLGRIDDQTAVLTRITGVAGTDPGDPRDAALVARYDLAMAGDDLVLAERTARELVALRTGRTGEIDPEAPTVAEAEGRLAMALSLPTDQPVTAPRLIEAEALYRRLLAESPAAGRGVAARNLGNILMTTSDGDPARAREALALGIEGLEDQRRRLGVAHPAATSQAILVAMFMSTQDRNAEARRLIDDVLDAETAGAPVSAKQRGELALLRAKFDFDAGDKAGAYRGIADSADSFRDFAIQTGAAADRRRVLDSWSFLYRGQVMMAWRLAEPDAKAGPGAGR